MKMIIAPLLCFIALASVHANPLPKLEGWQGPSYVETYGPDNLFEHINGSAPSYLACDFEKLWAGEYSKEGASISVEVYQHASPAMALGIYSEERSTRGTFIEVGFEGYLLKNFAALASGPYYVRIDIFEMPDDQRLKLPELIAEIERGLNAGDRTITPLRFFPKENQRPHSAVFKPENFLGQPALSEAYEMSYSKDGKKWRAFLMPKGSTKECMQTMLAYLNAIKSESSIPANQTVKIEDPYNGPIYFHLTADTIIGIYGNTDEASAGATIRKIISNLTPK
ncbi:DUF6599 family protein [Verrucomicrobiota bacterium]